MRFPANKPGHAPKDGPMRGNLQYPRSVFLNKGSGHFGSILYVISFKEHIFVPFYGFSIQ